MAKYRKVNPRDPLNFQARWYNDVTDLLRKSKLKPDPTNKIPPGLLAKLKATHGACTFVRVRNDTGADRFRFDVAVLGDIIHLPPWALPQNPDILPWSDQWGMKAESPTATTDCYRMCVFVEPVKQGNVGLAVVGGPAIVRMKNYNDLEPWCSMIPGDCEKTESNAEFGVPILQSGLDVVDTVDNPDYSIVYLTFDKHPSWRMVVTLTSDFVSTDPTFSQAIYTGGSQKATQFCGWPGLQLKGLAAGTLSITVYNPYGHYGSTGMQADLLYDMYAGEWVVVGVRGYKPRITFTLAATLTTADASVAGTITGQQGPGIANPNTGNGDITLYNHETDSAGTYMFYGPSGKTGVATWGDGNNYYIDIMQCQV